MRKAVLARLKSFPEDKRRQEERSLCSLLEKEALLRGFEVILTTLPFEEEPDLTSFLTRWLALGRRLALARTAPGRQMDFRFVTQLEGPWEVKRGGLREPPVSFPSWEPGPPTLCLVPGLAFAPENGRVVRLGRGGGYYDRWLAQAGTQVTTWGIGFSVQRERWLPREPHDQTLDDWKHGSVQAPAEEDLLRPELEDRT